MVRFALSFASHPRSIELVQRAEAAGYDAAWYYDSPALGSDPFVMLGLTAQATTSIDLGLGVAVPMLRLPHALATAVGTLNVFAPNRLRLGLGTGFTGALSIGAKPTSWSAMAETTRVVRGWLRGAEVDMTVNGLSRKVRHLHTQLGHLNTQDEVPIYISATGQRGLKVAGELADGLWTISVDQRPTPAWLREAAGTTVEQAARRGTSPFPVALLTAVAVQGPTEPLDSARLRSFLGPWITTYLHSVFPIFAGDPRDNGTLTAGRSSLNGPAHEDDLLDEMRKAYFDKIIRTLPTDAPWLTQHLGHSVFVRPEEEEFITAEMLQRLALVGPPAQLIEEIAALENAGLTELVWQVIPGHEDEIEAFANEVMQPYRQRRRAVGVA